MYVKREGHIFETREWDGDRLMLRFLYRTDLSSLRAVRELDAPLEVIFERIVITELDAAAETFNVYLYDTYGFDYLDLGDLTGGAVVEKNIVAKIGADRGVRIQCMGTPILNVVSATAQGTPLRGALELYCLDPRHRS